MLVVFLVVNFANVVALGVLVLPIRIFPSRDWSELRLLVIVSGAVPRSRLAVYGRAADALAI